MDDGENEDKVLGDLFLKVCEIEDCLQAYRDAVGEVARLKCRLENQTRTVSRLSEEIAEMKVRIEEVAKALSGGKLDIDEKLRLVCNRESYKRMKERLQEEQKKLKDIEEKLKKAIAVRDELRRRIKSGNFSLDGLEPIKTVEEVFY